MGRLINRFGWSTSRGETLEKCARAFYWHYFGSWEGWPSGTGDASAKLAYRLKKLSNRWGWSGDVVHQVIRRAIGDWRHGRDAPPAEELILGAKETMRRELKESSTGGRKAKNSRGFWGLLEHEYREDVPREKWIEIWERTEKSLRNFFASSWERRIRAIGGADAILELDDAGGEPSGFTWRGYLIYAQPDLVVRVKHDRPDEVGDPAVIDAETARAAGPPHRSISGAAVWDWKTGKPSEGHAEQVLLYALSVEATHKIPRDRISGHAAYLLGGKEKTFASSPEDFARLEDKLQRGIDLARSYLVDGDVSRNKPKPMEAFAQTENRNECARCAFRRLCGR